MIRPFQRRFNPAWPNQCGCPLLLGPCGQLADGEDRLCSDCRKHHHPDLLPELVEEAEA